ncbi:hypothetical protein NQZ68_002021 [Scomber scombrus]|uniref:Uncharacterized protein n=1 Tax=Scomber scombrus TaxID=13677 RepID=A0AAV1P643_SCOSC
MSLPFQASNDKANEKGLALYLPVSPSPLLSSPAVSLDLCSLQMGPGCCSTYQDDVGPSCLLLLLPLLFLGLYPLSNTRKPDTTFKRAHLSDITGRTVRQKCKSLWRVEMKN